MASTRSVSGSPCSSRINPTKRPPQIAHSDPAATQPRHTILAQRMAETHGAGPGAGAGARYVKTIQPVGVLSCHLLWLQCYKVTPFSPQTTQPLPQQPVAAPVPAVASRQTAGHKHKPPAPIKTRTRGSGAAQVKYFLYVARYFSWEIPKSLLFYCTSGAAVPGVRRGGGSAQLLRWRGMEYLKM